MNEERYLLIIYLILINAMSLIMYGLDKFKAKKKKWRIPESALLMSAACGGALGAFVSMQMFRHKTKHPKFQILVPVFLVLWIALSGYIFYVTQ